MLKVYRKLCQSTCHRGPVWLAWSRVQPLSSSAGQDANSEVTLPDYVEKQGETVEVLRARLQYQSRKRGTLENGLLLSTFCSRYLNSFTEPQLVMYDHLINKPSNEWDIFYWATGKTAVPSEFDNEVMSMLKDFTKNVNKESRISQPPLQETWK